MAQQVHGMAAPGTTRIGAASRRANLRRRTSVTGVLLTLPALAALAVTVIYPICWLVSLSFQSFSIAANAGPARFAGLANYRTVLTGQQFQQALVHTVSFVVVSLGLELLIAFPIALALNKVSRGARVFQLIVALPLMVAPVVGGMAWRFLFSNGYGLINSLLGDVGIHGPSWLATPWLARASVMAPNLWLALPFDVLVLLAGLANLPHDPFEAARIDGAGRFQSFRYLTLPLLRPALLIILVVRLADAFRLFDLVYILTGSGPANATDMLSTYIYRLMFTNVNFAAGAASATLLTVITAIAAGLAVLLVRRKTV